MAYSRSYLKKFKNQIKYGRNTYRNKKNSLPNKFEQSMYNILNFENIKFEREYQIPGTYKFFDVFASEFNTLIEFDGDYWHPKTLKEAHTKIQKRNFKNDIFKNQLAFRHGYKLIRIRQSENVKSIKKLLQ